MTHVLRVGVADQIAYFRAYNTDGSAKTDLTSATTGLTLSVFRIGASSVSIASLSDKAADDSTHADGAIRAVGGNLYTIDIPDAATATQVPSIVVRGSYTGGVVEGLEHPIVAYNPADVAVGANTTTPPTESAIADAVWDEPYNQHTTAGSFGKLMDTLRKANLTIDGTVSNAITPTTLTFSSDVVAVTSAYAHAVLLFVSGPLEGENSPIISYTSTNGVFVLEEPLTAAPSNGDEFVVIAGSHVHAIADIAAGIEQLPIMVTPVVSQTPVRVIGQNISTFIGDLSTITVGVFSGSDSVDLSGFGDLEVCVQARSGVDLDFVPMADLTISGTDNNYVSWDPAGPSVADVVRGKWSLRKTSNKQVIAYGAWIVEDAALEDTGS